MANKVRVAIVGLGFGAEFIPIYQAHPDAEMYAICRRDRAGLDACGEQFGVAKRYTSYDEVLRDPDVDAVHINSPIPDHAPQSLAALRAGKHVACTVPMGVSVDECRQVVEAGVPPGDAELVPHPVQPGLVPPADGVHLGVRVGLVDRDELGPEPQPDDRDSHSLRHVPLLLSAATGVAKTQIDSFGRGSHCLCEHPRPPSWRIPTPPS